MWLAGALKVLGHKDVVGFVAGLFGTGNRRQIAAAQAIGVAAKLRNLIDTSENRIEGRETIPAYEAKFVLERLEDYVADLVMIPNTLGVDVPEGDL